ncbi:hypothetical protein ACFODZ_02655 [Marinicella sediminis]|uniref:Uncharacterized protein n=1 Tax=Marinicella sediminis TaxID=1792834 RepID=A0ABV7J5C6_9GAMM|nr:hypothetical protein [Marinicella sediminis]
MKKNKLTMAVVAGIAGVAGMANAAQYVNPEGHGQVLIYPYYSVNNGLNTLYSVVNTTADTKAVKVRFLEGENTLEVLDFNVYLSAYDVWTGALGPFTSTIAGHVGEPSGVHVSSDTSCAPFLNKAGQEFLPYTIDEDDATGNTSMRRSTDGHFEVLEMATFIGPTIGWADHGATGVPANCGAIQADWDDNNFYDTADEDLVTGGLFGSASIVNVAEGLAMTYDAIAIDEFWTGGVGSHSEPGSLLPSLAQGDLEAIVFQNGAAVSSTFLSGAEAVSALFTKQAIYNEYALDSIVNGKTEWVITFPTKNFHVDEVVSAIPPFVNTWNGSASCHEFQLTMWDREEQEETVSTGGVSPRPPAGENPQLCLEVNVVEFILPGGVAGAESSIMGSDNLVTVTTPSIAHATENGWARMEFNDDDGTAYVTSAIAGADYVGLPVVGFAAQQFSNGGAGAGLLAQYAGLFVHKGRVVSQ